MLPTNPSFTSGFTNPAVPAGQQGAADAANAQQAALYGQRSVQQALDLQQQRRRRGTRAPGHRTFRRLVAVVLFVAFLLTVAVIVLFALNRLAIGQGSSGSNSGGGQTRSRPVVHSLRSPFGPERVGG